MEDEGGAVAAARAEEEAVEKQSAAKEARAGATMALWAEPKDEASAHLSAGMGSESWLAYCIISNTREVPLAR